MKKLVAAGFLLVVGAELMALAAPDRRMILVMSGVAVALCAARGALVPGAGVRRSMPTSGTPTTPQSRCAAGCLAPRR